MLLEPTDVVAPSQCYMTLEINVSTYTIRGAIYPFCFLEFTEEDAQISPDITRL